MTLTWAAYSKADSNARFYYIFLTKRLMPVTDIPISETVNTDTMRIWTNSIRYWLLYDTNDNFCSMIRKYRQKMYAWHTQFKYSAASTHTGSALSHVINWVREEKLCDKFNSKQNVMTFKTGDSSSFLYRSWLQGLFFQLLRVPPEDRLTFRYVKSEPHRPKSFVLFIWLFFHLMWSLMCLCLLTWCLATVSGWPSKLDDRIVCPR